MTETMREIGEALIHFLWQGAVLALVLHLVLTVVSEARARHALALSTLGMMLLAPVATFLARRDAEASDAGLLESMAIDASWINVLVVAWLAGVLLLSLRALSGWYLTETLRRCDVAPLPAALAQRCTDLAIRVVPRRSIDFLQSARVRTLVLVGWLRPVILIPAAALAGMPAHHLDALVLHELAHVRRLDALANLLLVAAETILFYHPAVWWVARQVRTEREHCCDDMAAAWCGDSATYAEALATAGSWHAVPALVLAATGSRLKARVVRLLGVPAEPQRSPLSALIGLAFACVLAASVATAQSDSTKQRFAIRIVDETSADAPSAPDADRVLWGFTTENPGAAVWVKRQGQIVGGIAEAHVASQNGAPVVAFQFTPHGQAAFAALTREHVGKRLAIMVDGKVISAPVIKEPITGGRGVISGRFNVAEAGTIASAIAESAK